MIDKKNLIIFGSCLGIVFLIFILFSFWRVASLKNIETGLNKELEGLKIRVEHLELNSKDSSDVRIEDLEKKGSRSVQIVAPNGGESLCLGKNAVIKWESKGVKAISLGVRRGNVTYSIGDFPASFNETGEENGSGEFSWKVGDILGGNKLEESFTYETVVSSSDSGSAVSDSSDKVFSIIRCEG